MVAANEVHCTLWILTSTNPERLDQDAGKVGMGSAAASRTRSCDSLATLSAAAGERMHWERPLPTISSTWSESNLGHKGLSNSSNSAADEQSSIRTKSRLSTRQSQAGCRYKLIPGPQHSIPPDRVSTSVQKSSQFSWERDTAKQAKPIEPPAIRRIVATLAAFPRRLIAWSTGAEAVRSFTSVRASSEAKPSEKKKGYGGDVAVRHHNLQ
mmetsp:Transcript_14811/g.32952  ORF Transcript_14811/g.32952 Transcript_14811/m.32952 type:complete len:211 (-) Transcript_14811:1241-1873(-)